MPGHRDSANLSLTDLAARQASVLLCGQNMQFAQTLSGKGLYLVAPSEDKAGTEPPAQDSHDEGKRLSLRVSLLIWLAIAGAGWLAIILLARLAFR